MFFFAHDTENKKKLIKAEDVKKELEKLLAAEGKLYMDWMNDEFTKGITYN